MESFNGQYLSVDETHKLYYEVHGNLAGKKFLFLHGGPGLGTTKRDLGFFDLKKVTVILLDQRGCGKSTPKGELKNNNTENLIEDINQLLLQLNFDKVYLFGGSWGSALSLLFGIKYPEKVEGMILRGLFTTTLAERSYFEKGGAKEDFPEVWNRFASHVPTNNQYNIFDYYFKSILSGNPMLQKLLAFELSFYGASLSSQENKLDGLDEKIKSGDFLNGAKILAHFSLNNFFLTDDFIENNLSRITNIPIKIIHGKNDHITLPSFAINFSNKLPNCQLRLVDGGHSSQDKNIKKALVRSVRNFAE